MEQGALNKYIKYETAILAKEKGFNRRCKFMFDRNKEFTETPSIKTIMSDGGGIKELKTPKQIFAPRQTDLQDWLRETKRIMVWVSPIFYDGWRFLCDITLSNGESTVIQGKTWRDALENGLYKALELSN